MSTEREYRPDIDGLRGIAVLAVFLYHLSFKSLFGGGYVGVDIFFVISGYLITRIIANEMNAGTFSFAKFYTRRIRRILPAFIVLCVVCFLVGRSLLSPDEFTAFCKSMARSAIAMSNFYFYEHTGYFDAPARSSPFLHTWSLGVEEQFYLFFPILMFFIYKFFYSTRIYLVVALTSMSFGFSFLVFFNQSFSFFMLPARAWELLIGSAAAMIPFSPSSERHGQTMRFVGLTMLAGTIVSYQWLPNAFFPGLTALPPCVGSLLCIMAGPSSPKSISYRLLTFKPLVFVGLISYSLYLWHWPIIVFARQIVPYLTLSPSIIATVIPLSFIAATLSWKFIEQPIRKKRVLASNRTLVPVCLIAVAGIFYVCMELKNTLGPSVSPVAARYLIFEGDYFPDTPLSRFDAQGFALGKQEPKPTFLLFGDSHALMLSEYIDKQLQQRGVSGFRIWAKNPLIGTKSLYENSAAEQENIRKIMAASSIDTVVLSMRWSQYTKGLLDWELETLTTDIWPISYDYQGVKSSNHEESLYLGFDTTVKLFLESGVKHIYIVQPVPEHNFFPAQSASRLVQQGKNPEEILYTPMEEYLERHTSARSVIQRIADAHPEVTVVDLTKVLCADGQRCISIQDGQSLYSDDDHLSAVGAKTTAPVLDVIFENLPERVAQ